MVEHSITMDWRVFMGILFIICTMMIIWGAWQGWFSPTQRPSPPPSPLIQENKQLRESVQTASTTVFEQSNDLAEKNAIIADLQRKLQELTDIINQLTTKLNQLETENAQLKTALKQALEDLATCRKALQQCKAELAAKRIADAYCKMQPENSNLLR